MATGWSGWRWPKWGIAAAALSLAVLFVFAWVFHLERTTTYDSAYFSWLLIDTGEPVIIHSRAGAVIPQLLPLALHHLGVPLETFLRGYSLSFVLWQLFYFLLILLVLKDRVAAMAFPLVIMAASRYAFYYPMAELQQGAALCVVLWALLRRPDVPALRKRYLIALCTFLLTVWISFHHHLLLIPVIFIVIYTWIRKQKRPDASWIIMVILMISWYLFRILFLTTSEYEAQRMAGMDGLLAHLRELDGLPSTIYLIENFQAFKAMLLLLLATPLMLLFSRHWMLAFFTIISTAGMLVFILLLYAEGDSSVMYESYLSLTALFLAIPFVDMLEHPPIATSRGALAGRALFVLLLLLSWRTIHQGHVPFTNKVQFAERITDEARDRGIRKAIAHMHNFPWAYGWVIWASPFETALVSAIKGPQQVVTVFHIDELEKFKTHLAKKHLFLGPDWSPFLYRTDLLDNRYFRIPPEATYHVITTPGTLSDDAGAGIQVEPLRTSVRMSKAMTTVTRVLIHNSGTDTLHARTPIGGPARLLYSLHDLDGGQYDGFIHPTELEIDIPPGRSVEHALIIHRPDRPGRFKVEVILMHDEGPHIPLTMRGDLFMEVP